MSYVPENGRETQINGKRDVGDGVIQRSFFPIHVSECTESQE
jgi:hypothetical protein